MSGQEGHYPPPFDGRSYDYQAYVDSKNWINGQWVDAEDGDTLVVENPRHGKPLGTTPASKAVDVNAAVAAAKAAFPGWRATPLKERVQVLYRMKNLMEKHLEELTWLLSHENGKTYAEAKASVMKGIECLEMGISLPNMVAGVHLASHPPGDENQGPFGLGLIGVTFNLMAGRSGNARPVRGTAPFVLSAIADAGFFSLARRCPAASKSRRYSASATVFFDSNSVIRFSDS